MNAKELIKENNDKRKLLSKENEAYYGDLMVYIRLHITISEQQTEELLMELLDHLIEAQRAGKSAEEVFGNNPKAYCDEMIKQLPKEKGKNTAFFLVFLIFQLAGWMAVVKGGIETIVGLFKKINSTLYVGSAIVQFLIASFIILVAVALILIWLKNTTFKQIKKINSILIVFSIIFFTMLGFVLLPRLVPPFGFAIKAGGVVFLILGLVVLLLSKGIDRKFQITK